MVSGCRISLGSPMQISHFPCPALPLAVGLHALLSTLVLRGKAWSMVSARWIWNTKKEHVSKSQTSKTKQSPSPREPTQSSMEQICLCARDKTEPLPGLSFVSSVLGLIQVGSHSVCYDNKITRGLSSLRIAWKLNSTKLASVVINSDKQWRDPSWKSGPWILLLLIVNNLPKKSQWVTI